MERGREEPGEHCCVFQKKMRNSSHRRLVYECCNDYRSLQENLMNIPAHSTSDYIPVLPASKIKGSPSILVVSAPLEPRESNNFNVLLYSCSVVPRVSLGSRVVFLPTVTPLLDVDALPIKKSANVSKMWGRAQRQNSLHSHLNHRVGTMESGGSFSHT